MKTNQAMIKHQVEIIETLRKVVTIELPADVDGMAALAIVTDRYYHEDIVLSADDHVNNVINYLGIEN